MRKVLSLLLGAGLTVVVVGGLSQAANRDETIKKVMKEAMKGGLCKKVADGGASTADKEALLKLFQDMAKATPGKGDPKSWEEKTKALVVAAEEIVAGKAEGTAKLKTAVNCKACHDSHK